MAVNDVALTAADYAAGLRALADVLDAAGLPASIRFPKQALTTSLYVNSAAAVRDFALEHDLLVKVSENHTTTQLALGPNPNTYYDGSAVLTIVHIDDDEPEEAPVEEGPAQVCPRCAGTNGNHGKVHERYGNGGGGNRPCPNTPEPVYLEFDGVVMKTTSDDSALADLYDYGWQKITEAEAMSWRPLDDVDDEPAAALPGGPVHVPPSPVLSPGARTMLADVLSSVADGLEGADVERVDPDDPTSMALPVLGDTVLLHDGTTARVLRRRYASNEAPVIADKWQVTGPNGARVVGLDEIAGYPEDVPTSSAPSDGTFKVDDRVIVAAEHHKDYCRRGVVVSVGDKDWPIGVRVGMGLGAVIHHFREDELSLDLATEGAAVLAAEPGVTR